MALSRRHWWVIAGLVVVVGVVAPLVLLLSAHHGRRLPPARARVYRDYDVCLLTGSAGLADPSTRAVWTGMQDVSQATAVRVSYLAVSGPDTVANTLPYAQALVQRHCGVIVAAGSTETTAAAQVAPGHLEIRFVLVGDAGGTGVNVSTISDADLVRTRSDVATSVQRAMKR